MRLRAPYITIIALAVSGSAFAHEGRRHVDKHSHGEGNVSVAIEGKRVELALEAPAHDIVGFEHAPRTAAQKKRLADAIERLNKADELFTLAPAAGCKLASAKVEIVGAASGKQKDGKASAGHSQSHGHSHGQKGKGEEASHHSGQHSELHATYAWDCEAVDKLASISFGYFKAFKGAEKLIVTVIASKGQTQLTVTRRKPVANLGGSS